MFNRIFGGSEADQLAFLESRSIITLVVLIGSIVLSMIFPEALGLVALVMLFLWGWPVVRNLFGVTVVSILFSGNIVIGVVLFVVYITVAYFAGIIFAFLGIGRWLYLKAKHK